MPTSANTGTAPMPIPIRLGFVGYDGDALRFSINGEAAAAEQVVVLSGASQTLEMVEKHMILYSCIVIASIATKPFVTCLFLGFDRDERV